MEQLLQSRMRKDVSPSRLTLSPDKYGKAAWADLTYTPAKLADNPLFREATTLRKAEEGCAKLREFQAMNDFMKERLLQVEQERNGIETSLTQQLTMYRRMLSESQSKHELRLREIQKRFTTELSVMIQQKEEEAKFWQAQQEMLESRIAELESQLGDSQEREETLRRELQTTRLHCQQLQNESADYRQKLMGSEKERAYQQHEAKKKEQDAAKRYQLLQTNSKQQIQHLQLQRIKDRQSQQRLLRTELQKAENLRMGQNMHRSQQMREIMTTFESETRRLNEIIAMKDRMLEALTADNAQNKQHLLELTATYDNRLAAMTHDRKALAEQAEVQMRNATQLQGLLDAEMAGRQADRQQLGSRIAHLQEELRANQVSMVREQDRFEFWGADLQKEMERLRMENAQVGEVVEENARLGGELRRLRDLLMESSFEIERCKEELVRMSYERDSLAARAEKVQLQRERAYRQREVQSESWLRSAYTARSPFR